MTAAAPQGLTYPAWFADLVDRAASVLHMHQGRMSSVPFEWWADGDDLEFLASMVWHRGDAGPRVEVHYLRSGDLVCRSLIGNMYAIDPDPAAIAIDATGPPDEIERAIWNTEQAQQQRQQGG